MSQLLYLNTIMRPISQCSTAGSRSLWTCVKEHNMNLVDQVRSYNAVRQCFYFKILFLVWVVGYEGLMTHRCVTTPSLHTPLWYLPPLEVPFLLLAAMKNDGMTLTQVKDIIYLYGSSYIPSPIRLQKSNATVFNECTVMLRIDYQNESASSGIIE